MWNLRNLEDNEIRILGKSLTLFLYMEKRGYFHLMVYLELTQTKLTESYIGYYSNHRQNNAECEQVYVSWNISGENRANRQTDRQTEGKTPGYQG